MKNEKYKGYNISFKEQGYALKRIYDISTQIYDSNNKFIDGFYLHTTKEESFEEAKIRIDIITKNKKKDNFILVSSLKQFKEIFRTLKVKDKIAFKNTGGDKNRFAFKLDNDIYIISNDEVSSVYTVVELYEDDINYSIVFEIGYGSEFTLYMNKKTNKIK